MLEKSPNPQKMSDIVIYTKTYCPFSKECKKFLENKGLNYHEKTIDGDPATEMEMKNKSGFREDTPQLIINGHHIGNFDDLKALDATDKLDQVLHNS